MIEAAIESPPAPFSDLLHRPSHRRCRPASYAPAGSPARGPPGGEEAILSGRRSSL